MKSLKALSIFDAPTASIDAVLFSHFRIIPINSYGSFLCASRSQPDKSDRANLDLCGSVSRTRIFLVLWADLPKCLHPKSRPSSNGMFSRKYSPFFWAWLRDRSCIPYLEPRIISTIFSRRACPESIASDEILGTRPKKMIVNNMGLSRGRYCSSKGQLMNTFSSKDMMVIFCLLAELGRCRSYFYFESCHPYDGYITQNALSLLQFFRTELPPLEYQNFLML